MEMAIASTDAVLAMRCPECGKLEYNELSRFQLSGARSIDITCSCGAVKLSINTKNHKEYWLQIPCVVCETRHLHTIPGRLMWSGRVHYLLCQETGLELGFLGPEEEVKEMASGYEEEMQALVNEFAGDEYFHNSGIMYEVLNCLHDIAERDALYCQCGNRDVDVDIFPDRLELHCKECDSVNIIYAENDEDLKVIQKVDNIELTKNGFECLDSCSSTGRSFENKKRKRNK